MCNIKLCEYAFDSSTFCDRYDGNETIGHRLYKEVCQIQSMSKVKNKKSISAITSQWETLATTFEEFQNFVVSQQFSFLPNYSTFQ